MLDDTYSGRDIPEPLQHPTNHKKEPPRKLEGWPLYLAIIGTAYVVASLVLVLVGVASLQSINHTVRTQDQKIEQLQVDTNDNLCNQSAYSAGNTCEGGDGNG
jgi:hypothetical protein